MSNMEKEDLTIDYSSQLPNAKAVGFPRRDYSNDWIEHEIENNFINAKCWSSFDFTSGNHLFIVAAEINGKSEKFEFKIRELEFTKAKFIEEVRKLIAEMVVDPLTESVLERMSIDGNLRQHKG